MLNDVIDVFLAVIAFKRVLKVHIYQVSQPSVLDRH